jgi:hypothetical protein
VCKRIGVVRGVQGAIDIQGDHRRAPRLEWHRNLPELAEVLRGSGTRR